MIPCVLKNCVSTPGIYNDKQLFLISHQVIFVRLVMSAGSVVNELLLRYNCFNVVSVVSESGSVIRPFVQRFNVVKTVRFSISGGTIQIR